MAGTLKIGGNTIATHAGAEGAGTVTLDSSTLAIGSNTSFSGATLNGATFPAGHIIQVEQAINGTAISRTGDQSTMAYTGVSCTFSTALTSGSKIYAQVEGTMWESSGGHWGGGHLFTFYQNSVNICGNQITDPNTQISPSKLALRAVGSDNSNNNYWRGNFAASALFTPTGDATAKKTVQLWWRYGSTASHTAYLNTSSVASSDNTGGAVMLTLMEIAG